MDVIGTRFRERQATRRLTPIDRMNMASSKRQRQFHARRSGSGGVPEHAWETVRSGVFFPVAPLKKAWDLVVMLLIVYSVVMVPFRVGFEAQAEGYMWIFEVVVTLTFCADLVATFNSAYLDGAAGRRPTADRGQLPARLVLDRFARVHPGRAHPTYGERLAAGTLILQRWQPEDAARPSYGADVAAA